MRHLTNSQAHSALRRGKQIEQYLGRSDGTIRWLTLAQRDGSFRLSLHQVEEPTDLHTYDLSELQPLDRTEYVGEGRMVCEATTWEEAAEQAAVLLHATSDRWVNQGMVGNEYADDLDTQPGSVRQPND